MKSYSEIIEIVEILDKKLHSVFNNFDFKEYTVQHKDSNICPSCRLGNLRLINGKYGSFLGCSMYPRCRYTMKYKI